MKNYTRLRFILLTVALVALKTTSNYATHVMGADIAYKWISGNTFQLQLSVYRDCSSPISIPTTQKVFYQSFSCRPTQDSIVMVMDAGSPFDISPVCKQEPSTCKGGVNPGIQRFRFTGTVTLPSQCADWVFYYRECNRSAGIGTLIAPQNSCLYVEARLNNLLAPQNSSPKIGNDPVSYLCMGQPANLNPGATEINGDMLRFQLVTPRTNSIIPNVPDNNIVRFKPGFSAQSPLPSASGFLFDTLTGQISFSPNQQITGVTAIRISEYRNGKLIGSIMQDIQLLVRDCENSPPVLSGFDGGVSYERLVCIGDTLNTYFTATDADASDSISPGWNGGIAEAEFSGDTAKGIVNFYLNWVPTTADTGIKTFTITATDNHCPTISSTTKSYQVRVRLKPTLNPVADTLINCGTTIPIGARVASGVSPFFYSWPGRTETTPTIQVGHGTYVARVTDQTGCFKDDTITLNGSSISAFIQTDTACVVEGLQLTAVPSSMNPNLTYSYEWKFPPENQVFTGKILRRTYPKDTTVYAQLKVTASDNCTITLGRFVRVCPRPPVFVAYAPNICQGQAFRIGCGIPGRGGLCGANSICIYLTGKNWQEFSQNGNITLPPDSLRPDSNSFKVVTISLSNCRNERDFKFKVKGAPKVNVTPAVTNLRYNCNRPDTSFVVKIFKDDRFINDSLWGRITLPDTVIRIPKTIADTIYYTLHLNKPGVVTITGIMPGNCTKSVSINYAVGIFAQVGILNNCAPTDTVSLFPNHLVAGATFSRFDLGNGTILSPARDTALVYNADQNYFGSLILGDSLGCYDTTRFTINTFFPDTTVLISSDSVCFSGNIKLKVLDTTLVYQWQFQHDEGLMLWPKGKREDSVSFAFPGSKSIKATIYYKSGCVTSWDLKPVWIRQPIRTASALTNVCAYDSTRFSASVLFSENAIEHWRWQYLYPPNINLSFLGDTVQNPVRQFGYNGAFRAILTGIDKNGCLGRDTLDSNMVMISKPEFDVNGNCQNDSLIFFFGRVPDQFENIDRFTYLYNDGSVEATSNGQGLHQFKEPGTYQIKLIAFSSEGCSNSDSTTLEIKPRPTAKFEMPPPEICQGQIFSVDGSSSLPATPEDKITSFVWATNEVNPYATDTSAQISIVDAGLAYVALQIKSTNGCQDYLKKEFASRPRPVPGFEPDESQLLESDLISFEDKSVGATAWQWDFGDGTTLQISDPTQASPSHKYNVGTTFNVEQWVVNQYGCADSITRSINLKSFIALPKAFSPNGDERNDGCRLLYRFIRNLDEFKIYNRLGQVVFDAGNNLDARWNGTLEGVNQPNGSYLYTARATSVFGESLELKGNITLIR